MAGHGIASGDEIVGQRLYLMADFSVPTPDKAAFESAFSGGDVAAVLFRNAAAADRARLQAAIATAQQAGAASIVDAGLDLAHALGADGVHVDASVDDPSRVLAAADGLIVGVGVRGRHHAMTAAELEIDYLMFGDPGTPNAPPHPKALEDAAWWADTFVVPAVLVGGPGLDDLASWIGASSEFIALEAAVWTDPDGPASAVARINRALRQAPSVAA